MAIKENKFLTIDGDIVRVEKRVIERTVRTSEGARSRTARSTSRIRRARFSSEPPQRSLRRL